MLHKFLLALAIGLFIHSLYLIAQIQTDMAILGLTLVAIICNHLNKKPPEGG